MPLVWDGGRAMEEGVEVAPPSRVDDWRPQSASVVKLPRVWAAVAEGETVTTATKGTKGRAPMRFALPTSSDGRRESPV